MKTTRHTKTIVTAIAAGALAVSAPAGASVLDPVSDGWNAGGSEVSTVTAISHESGANSANAVTLRRDGSQATAFVADVSGPENTAAAADENGFDWGDASIGAVAGLIGATLLLLGPMAVGSRRRSTSEPGGSRGAISQGA